MNDDDQHDVDLTEESLKKQLEDSLRAAHPEELTSEDPFATDADGNDPMKEHAPGEPDGSSEGTSDGSDGGE